MTQDEEHKELTKVLDRAKELLADRYNHYLIVGMDGEQVHFDYSSAIVAKGMVRYVGKVIEMEWEDSWIQGE